MHLDCVYIMFFIVRCVFMQLICTFIKIILSKSGTHFSIMYFYTVKITLKYLIKFITSLQIWRTRFLEIQCTCNLLCFRTLLWRILFLQSLCLSFVFLISQTWLFKELIHLRGNFISPYPFSSFSCDLLHFFFCHFG